MPKLFRTRNPGPGKADFARMDAMTEEEIEATAPEELPFFPDSFWKNGRVVEPILGKQAISLRIDAEVLDWFRATGPRYQTRINEVLKEYVIAVRKPPRKRKARGG